MLKKIQKILLENPKIKARVIAKKLSVDRSLVSVFLRENLNHFEQDEDYCWSVKTSGLRIEFESDSWIDCKKFEKTLSAVESPLQSQANAIVFIIPKGCNLLLEVIARLIALANQLAHQGKKVTIDFSSHRSSFTYVNRIGFFDHLHEKVIVLPNRPKISSAEVYKENNDNLVELAPIDANNLDETIPERFKKVFVSHAGDEYEQTAFTIISESYGNVRDHSKSPLLGFIGLQLYQNVSPPHIQTVISDSGAGILNTLKLVLDEKYPEIAEQMRAVDISPDVYLLKKVFTEGHISQSYDEGRGLGLNSSAIAASKFNATIGVRQENCEVRFFYRNGRLTNITHQTDMPSILGTHICFDFKLD
ncbi:ATP-binding protein [Methylotenera oryzisoli]|uniref:ATP-binding protein n=1 Tax=Methylotenera oryzisoli TaxID=2080758 RepID=A0A4Y9VSR9_9PROT|nr:ATP-binding protein [Methylotenera oryzisoli]TFW72344.1 ATP-binding protein [Methylotenera oryzisoli]